MKVMLCGGGTGGHTMPLLAVADYLRKKHPQVELCAILERDDERQALSPDINTSYIYSGKWRRYWGEGAFKALLDWRRQLLNIRDGFKVMVGFIQSVVLLLRHRPNVVFIKGGYVSLPLGLAAGLLNIPYVTHDSDTVPGLTNRILAKGAVKNLVGFPVGNYNYPEHKIQQVGVPVRPLFSQLNRASARRELNIPHGQRRIVVIGGSVGARRLNLAAAKISSKLATMATVVHVAGKGDQFTSIKPLVTQNPNYQLVDFLTDDIGLQLAAADVVVTRAGATALAEFACLGSTVVVVPNPQLTDGHQIKNGQAVNSFDAGIVIKESLLEQDPNILLATVDELLVDPDRRRWLANNIKKMLPSDAAKNTAKVLIDEAQL